jgi:trigger factor
MVSYQGVTIPSDVHQVSDEDVQREIDNILASHITTEQITDRAVVDGDRVNIDYVGSVDGVEFDGGSTMGGGTDVMAGGTEYIDDFLDQLIGHMPGETFNVEVTFPEDYGQEHLNGKDAVFVTTINHISNDIHPELTDAFIAENLSLDYGWTTVDQMMEEVRTRIRRGSIQMYLNDNFFSEITVLNVPEQLISYQNRAMMSYYRETAMMYGMEFEEFIEMSMGVATVDELVELNSADNIAQAEHNLVSQAIAEDAALTVSEADLVKFFLENLQTDDYSTYEEQFGMPYLKHVVLSQMVLDHIAENAILA